MFRYTSEVCPPKRRFRVHTGECVRDSVRLSDTGAFEFPHHYRDLSVASDVPDQPKFRVVAQVLLSSTDVDSFENVLARVVVKIGH